MTRDDLIEAMAKGIWNSKDGAKVYPWDTKKDFDKAPYREEASAALSALEDLVGLVVLS